MYKELESLGFFEWLDKIHNLVDTDMKPEYLDRLPLDDIHRTVCNAMAFRWFREKYDYDISIRGASFRANWAIGIPLLINNDSNDGHPLVINWEYIICDGIGVLTYEEAENACIDKLIEIAKQQDK